MDRLSICAATVFPELSFEQRVRAIACAGYWVEFWRWQGRDPESLAAAPDVHFSGFGGFAGGSMLHPDGVETYLDGLRAPLEIARRINCQNLFVAAGELGSRGEVIHAAAGHPATTWITAYECLCRIAEMGEAAGVVFHLEQFNTKQEHAGYKLNHHIADVPGRHEPGTGEINFPRIADALREVGYDNIVGKVAVNYKNDAGGAATTRSRIRDRGGEAEVFQADIGSKAGFERLVDAVCDRFGRLDVLVNNAARTRFGHVFEITEDDFDDRPPAGLIA